MPKDDVIAALGKATGPDRELDAAIFYDLLGHCRHANKVRSGAQSDTGFDCPDCGADSWGNTGPTGQRLHHTVPAYSASIDAALTLYIHRPDVVSTCPRKVCADALRQRTKVLGEGPEGGAQ